MPIIEKSEIMQEDLRKLAMTIVSYSLEIKEGENVLITTNSKKTSPLIKELIPEITAKKAGISIKIIDIEFDTYIKELANEKIIQNMANEKKYEVEHFDAFINIRYIDNDYEQKNITKDVKRKIATQTEEYDDIRINQRKWVLLNYPSHLDAYKAKMKNEEYFQYAMDVMNVDYKKMYEGIKPLEELMKNTDKVRIVSPNTDITFSIKGIPVVPCCGKSNIPDGEIFTAPIRESVNGKITYNTPSPYQGTVFQQVSLTFQDGKIIECHSMQEEEKLKEIFDTDEGARYIGEFSLGLNPKILDPMGDILYDEKIIGSIHFTPGRCYDDADNGNHSAIHWDLVLIQREEYGGGELYFDDVLIRKNGLFVLKELEHLNYNLK